MRPLLLTGGCGFIGSNFIRYLLETDPAVTRPQLRRPDLRRQPRQPRRPGEPAALPLRQGRHHRPRAVRRIVGEGVSRHHQLRGREPRRSQHPRFRPVRAHQRPGHASPARRRPGIRGAALRAGLDRRSVRQPRADRLLHRGDAAGSEQPLRGQQGRRRPAGAQLRPHLRVCPRVITRCSNNYGPYQFPEKLIPLFITNLLRERAGAGLRRRPATSATGSTSAITARPSSASGGKAGPARSTTSAATARKPTWN